MPQLSETSAAVNAAMPSGADSAFHRSAPDLRSNLLKAEEMLEEALALDPFNEHVRTNLETLRNLMRLLK